MKKRISIILAIMMVFMVVIYSLLYVNGERITTNLDVEVRSMIEDLYEVELPEKGNVIEYKCDIPEGEYGDIFAIIEFNEDDYESFVCQIAEKSSEEELDNAKRWLLDEYNMKTSGLKYNYLDVGGLRRNDADLSNEFGRIVTHYYNSYIFEVKDGVFKVIFEAYDI